MMGWNGLGQYGMSSGGRGHKNGILLIRARRWRLYLKTSRNYSLLLTCFVHNRIYFSRVGTVTECLDNC